MSQKHPRVDEFFKKELNWKVEMQEIRKIVLTTDLTEDYKWRQPCYTFEDKNVGIIGGFKDFCTFSFFKGVLLKDDKKVLEKPGENTRSALIFKFTSLQQIKDNQQILINYIAEAIALEKEGKEVDFTQNQLPNYPQELLEFFENDKKFQKAFEDLTPGRKRGYLLHFNAAKQSQTVINRIEKFKEKILNGKGMNDYK